MIMHERGNCTSNLVVVVVVIIFVVVFVIIFVVVIVTAVGSIQHWVTSGVHVVFVTHKHRVLPSAPYMRHMYTVGQTRYTGERRAVTVA